MTSADALSDALVALLQAHAPAGAVVVDHDALPEKVEDLPAGGVLGVYLFDDRPSEDDGLTDTTGRHPRRALFKVELRIPGTSHMLHGTRPARSAIAAALQADPRLGGLAHDARAGAFQVLVNQLNSRVAAGSVEVLVDYTFDPEA